MTAGLLLHTADTWPLVPPVEAMPAVARLLALSPRLVLPALPAIDRIAEARPSAGAGALHAPLSWHALALPPALPPPSALALALAAPLRQRRRHLLLARAQPGLAADGMLRLEAASGAITHLTLEAAGS